MIRRYIWLFILILLVFQTGCDGGLSLLASMPLSSGAPLTATPSPEEKMVSLETPTPAYSVTPTPTISPTHTSIPTRTATPTVTETPTVSATPTISLTPTPDYPEVKVLMQAFCRYGPGKAYLYSHGLYEGDQAEVHGRNYSGNWLWIQPENLDRHCWMAASVAEVSGDVSSAPVVTSRLPHSTLYRPPQDIETARKGDQVIVAWETVWMTEDDYRGYLIEATICQNGALISVAVHTDQTQYEFTDEKNCSGVSGGKLYTVEKHGYTDPVTIPWP